MKKNSNGFNRRELIRILPAIPLLGVSMKLSAETEKKPDAGASCELIEESNPVAQGLRYVHDTSKAEDKPDKMGVAGKDQNCANCQLYIPHDNKLGKCPLLPQGCVAADGWCNAWIKKA